MITIICNGQERQISPTTTVLDLIHELALDPDTVVVECDSIILRPGEYSGCQLRQGSCLELIRFVGGGS